jgi:hypothetical protein
MKIFMPDAAVTLRQKVLKNQLEYWVAGTGGRKEVLAQVVRRRKS